MTSTLLEAANLACKQIGQAVVMHDAFKRARDTIIELVELAEISGTPFGACVVGPSGIGKNTLISVLRQQVGSADLFGARPLSMSLSIQATPSVGQVIGAMLTQLSFPPTIRPAKVYEQSVDLVAAMKDQRVKLLFINEAHHLSEGGRRLSGKTITDYLKLVVDDTNIVVVMLGTASGGYLEQLNDQLFSRAPARCKLEAFPANSAWAAILQGLAKECEAFDISAAHTQFDKQVHKATKGLLRPLKQLLMMSVRKAALRGLLAIDQQALFEAFDVLFGDSGRVANPFAKKAGHAARAAAV